MLKKKKICILISSAGRRVELIQLFRVSAERLGLGLKILATDADPEKSAACQFADQFLRVKKCSQPGFLNQIQKIIHDHHVCLVIPTLDTELAPLAKLNQWMAPEERCIVISGPRVIDLTRDKWKTAEWLSGIGLPHPKTGTYDEVLAHPKQWKWPLIAKPIDGSCSKGISMVDSVRAMPFVQSRRDKTIFQEKWVGQEFTVNMYFDQKNKLRTAVPHLRIETRAGEVSKGKTVRKAELIRAARCLARHLPEARGPLCFQAIVKPSGQFAILEINARFGGGYPLTHHAGAEFTRWLLQEACGLPLEGRVPWRSGVQMLRYDAAWYHQ